MNEQIEKLARECFDVANDGNEDEYLGTTAGIEKFAELVVRDCASYIHGHELFTALLNRYGLEP